MHKDILDNYAGRVSMNSGPFAKTYKQSESFFKAMKDAGIIGAHATKETKNYRANVVMALFPRYFHYSKDRYITAINDMPREFIPSDDDDDDAEDDVAEGTGV